MRRSELLGGAARLQSSRTRLGWAAAGSLAEGMRVVTRDGRIAKVKAVAAATGLHTVHNFAVDGHHTYFVGKGRGVWVHNTYKIDLDTSAMARDPAFLRFARDKYGIGAGESLTPDQMSKAVVEFLQRGTDGMSAGEGTEKMRENVTNHLNAVGRDARRTGYGRFTGREASALAQNEAIIGIYASIGLQIPDFQWADLGIYVAQQVREELIGLADGRLSVDIVSDSDTIFDNTFEIQKQIVTDIAPLALGYDQYGASAMRGTFDRSSSAWWGFNTMMAADRVEANGQTRTVLEYRKSAAIHFGRHEQNRVQPIWDRMSGMGILNAVGGFFTGGWAGVSTNIQVRGVNNLGEIDAPGGLRGNTANPEYRIDIAENGFEWMYSNVHTHAANSRLHEANLQHFLGGKVRGDISAD